MSDVDAPAPPSPKPAIRKAGFADIQAALAEGFADFRRAPAFGLFFAAFYVVGGIVIYLQLKVLAQSYWVIPVAMGFPLLGPFAAVGLYEVSRRLEAGEPLDWAGVMTAPRAEVRADRAHDVDVPRLGVAANVVGLAQRALFQHQQ